MSNRYYYLLRKKACCFVKICNFDEDASAMSNWIQNKLGLGSALQV